MTLTLQIENFHVLDDGGPVSILVPESGIRVGRRDGMDWVLPDASRYISGHHFEVSFDGATWWLTDVSTNGTFLQGHRHRLGAPHSLSHGDRFQVGQYIIVAVFDMPDGGRRCRPRPCRNIGWTARSRKPRKRTPGRWMALAVRRSIRCRCNPRPGILIFPMISLICQRLLNLNRRRLPRHHPAPVDEAAFLRGFMRGAGLEGGDMPQADPEAFGRVLGEALRASASQLMLALQDRAAARHFTRAGDRTMRGASDNNPLKFLPDPEQAIEALFLKPRAGFLTGAAGFEEALSDLRRHQTALFAALQPALIELLHDLDPGRIEAEARGSALTGGRKGRAWETFVQRWDAKTASENGILDEFTRLFAAAYRKADEQGRK